MKLFPVFLALAVIGGPVVAKPRTPFWRTASGFAVATCWISNGIDTEKNIMRHMEKSLSNHGITKAQISRIVSLPGFEEEVETIIVKSGGCEKLIPQSANTTGPTYAL